MQVERADAYSTGRELVFMNVEMYERNLPPYLAHDLDAWKKGVVRWN